MSDYHHKQEDTGEHIWLRYATQFTAAGRSHTIEMSVPLPVGASDEIREQLLREAEKGLSHLISHVETRIPQILQHAQTHSTHPIPVAPAPANKVPVARPANRPASVPAPPTINQPSPANPQVREVREQKNELLREEEPGEIAQRSNGVSMPSLPGGGNGNLSIPEFIQAIKGLGLNPRQAMNLLKVKSLATGLNLREALERLQYLIAQEAGEIPDAASKEPGPQPPVVNAPVHRPTADRHTSPEPAHEEEPFENVPIPIFDEEIEPEEEEEDFAEPLDDFSPSLTPSLRSRARAIVDKLREARGATVVSPGRLQALHNVIGEQLSEDQLLTMTHRLWGVSILKRLKVDQVEALIYWAKEDDFMNEAEAVLALLEEEG
jgi:hypothetical protein